MTPTKRNREYLPTCILCDCAEEIVARRYSTLFASDFSHRAGTCASLGSFTLCHDVYPTIRAFWKDSAVQMAQRTREAQAYLVRWQQRQQEGEGREDAFPC